jgi:hypothetical protein
MEAELFNSLLDLIKQGNSIRQSCVVLDLDYNYLYNRAYKHKTNKRYNKNKGHRCTIHLLTEEQRLLIKAIKIETNSQIAPKSPRLKMNKLQKKEKQKELANRHTTLSDNYNGMF